MKLFITLFSNKLFILLPTIVNFMDIVSILFAEVLEAEVILSPPTFVAVETLADERKNKKLKTYIPRGQPNARPSR